MSNPYMVKQVITFSDGSEIVTNYAENPNKEEIETTVAEAVAGDHRVSQDVPVEEVSNAVEKSPSEVAEEILKEVLAEESEEIAE